MIAKKNILKVTVLLTIFLFVNLLSAQEKVTLFKFDKIEFLDSSGNLDGGSYKPANGGLIHWAPKNGEFAIQTGLKSNEFDKFRLDIESLKKVRQGSYITNIYNAKEIGTGENFIVEYTEMSNQHIFVIKPMVITNMKSGRFYRCHFENTYFVDN